MNHIKYSTTGLKTLYAFQKNSTGTGYVMLCSLKIIVQGMDINGSDKISYYDTGNPYTILTADSYPACNTYNWSATNPDVRFEYLDNGKSVKIWYSGEKTYTVRCKGIYPIIGMSIEASTTITESFFQRGTKITTHEFSLPGKRQHYHPSLFKIDYDDGMHMVRSDARPFVEYPGNPEICYSWDEVIIYFFWREYSRTNFTPLDKTDKVGVLGTYYTTEATYVFGGTTYIKSLHLTVKEKWPNNNIRTYRLETVLEDCTN